MEKGYDFDDLLLIPKISNIKSRDDVDTSVNFYDILKLKIPVIGSPMKGIMNRKLAQLLSDAGGIGILNRFYSDIDTWKIDVYTLGIEADQFGIAIGLGTPIVDIDFALSNRAKIICIDVADGYLEHIIKYCYEIKEHLIQTGYDKYCLLMAGNVATREGAVVLVDNGVDLVRVGVGSGQLCTTRNNTGVGIPQLTAIKNCFEQRYTIADGGIRNSGDAVKALAMGADAVMIGSLLAQCHESAHNGIIYGMASRRLQEEYFHSVKSVEGLEKVKEKTMYFKDFISEFMYGIRSGMTYLNAKTIDEIYLNAEWIEVGNGSIKSLG